MSPKNAPGFPWEIVIYASLRGLFSLELIGTGDFSQVVKAVDDWRFEAELPGDLWEHNRLQRTTVNDRP